MAPSVLVVDDDASFRRLASRVLASWGHDVIGEAESVAQAILRATELRPEAVLVDVELPDGDGFDLTADLLMLPNPPRVVLISSDAETTINGPAAARAGAAGFVPKDELTSALLRQLLEGA